MSIEWRFITIDSINDVEADAWDALFDDYPFTKHAFLSALESSGCVGEKSGWQPLHIIASDGS